MGEMKLRDARKQDYNIIALFALQFTNTKK